MRKRILRTTKNEPTKRQTKAHRDAVFRHILSNSNLTNLPTYEIPSENNKRNSALKKTTALENGECDICKIKFSRQGLTRHRNSCQVKRLKKSGS